ncbi:MIRO1-like protein [Mya arenaria]|uniref:MIRO1-like protein n=1 Tax=Mya arenaria TaxID=6604 RepID=A0ABY7DL03_MYAAR|nr:MIRO1-like protein [Mya arenaria]
MSSKEEVRILLVGDAGVGKTSLIMALVSEEFVREVPAKAEEIIIPAEADVVCIIWASNDEDSFEGVTSVWLPFIRRNTEEDQRTPVILVANKADLIEYSVDEAMTPIINDFPEVEASISICDMDNDQILSDDEVIVFQRKCFEVPIQPHALEEVKQTVQSHLADGFLFLMELFIERKKIETVWTVLRAFGYDDKLLLRKDVLEPKLNVGVGSTTELSHEGVQFLTSLFEKYDEDCDGMLSPTELTNLFSTCPRLPWGPDVNNTVVTNTSGWISLQGYLAQWTLTTLLEYKDTLEHLAYLGYLYHQDSTLSALQVTRDKKIDLQKRQTARNVFRCHVLGPKQVGKTAFLQGLIGRNLRYVATLNREQLSKFTINTVQVYGQEKYLMLHEVDVAWSDMLSPTETNCDVACLLYDVTNPRSFEFCARMYMKHFLDSRVPTLIVACKVEHPEVRQDYNLTPKAFCEKFKLPPPQRFTCIDKVNRDIYVKVATMAAYPNLKRLVHMLLVHQNPVWLEERLSHLKDAALSNDKRLIKYGIGVVTLAGIGFLVYKIVEKYNK